MNVYRVHGVALVLGIVIGSSAADAVAQPASVAPSTQLAVLVDGAQNPEQISDDVAYRHFLKSLAEPRLPSPIQMARRAALLRNVGLSRDDDSALLLALEGLREELDSIRREAAAHGEHALPAALADTLRSRETAAVEAAKTRALGRLSWDGWTKVDKHVREHVKRRIKIYGASAQ
jgi:hypothetical protein